MSNLVKLIIAVLIISQLSCSKSDNNIPVGPSLNTQSPIPDGLIYPVTKGSYWEYQRIDSFKSDYLSASGYALTIKADTSKELITLIGDALISSIDPAKRVLFLQIKNLTYSTLDTTYILYTSDRFSFFAHPITESDNFYFSPPPSYSPNLSISYTYWSKLATIPLPVKDFYISASNRNPIILDTTFTIKDTSIVVLSNTYNNCVFADYDHHYRSNAPTGVGGFTQRYYSFIKPGLGMVYEYFTPDYSQPMYNFRFSGFKWTVRRLVNYKIY